LTSSLKITLNKLKSFLGLLVLIGILKLISFLSPLLVNKISLSPEDYGIFEYSFNLGQILIPLLSMGLSGGYAFYVLKHKQSQMKAAFHFHFVFLTIVALVIAIAYPRILNNIYFGAILISLSFSNQIFLSGIKKIEDKNYTSIFVENGLYVILLIIVLTATSIKSNFHFHLWFLALLIYNGLLATFYHLKHINIKKIKKEDFKKIYAFGAKVMVAGVIVFLLCNSTRVFTKFFLNETSVGIYSIVFRIGTASVLIYKTIYLLQYKNFYLSNYKYLDDIFLKIAFSVVFVNVIIFLFFPFVSTYFIKDAYIFGQINNRLIITIFSQIVLWVNFSLLEPIFQRENKVIHQIVIISVAVFSMFFSMWVMDKYFTLELIHICLINNLMISLSSVFAVLYLKRERVILKKTMVINSFFLSLNIINFFI
jgi:hypothetical protein